MGKETYDKEKGSLREQRKGGNILREQEIHIEVMGSGEPSTEKLVDFWADHIGNRLKEEVPSKRERLEILEQILEQIR